MKYDDENICPVCGGQNKVDIKSLVNYHVSESSTECTECGHIDYWAYGFYESKGEQQND